MSVPTYENVQITEKFIVNRISSISNSRLLLHLTPKLQAGKSK